MEQEEKQLILQDLCARYPYGIYVLADVYKTFDGGIIGKVIGVNIETGLVYLEGVLTPFSIDQIKPYLRSMSSMTDEEKREYNSFFGGQKPFDSDFYAYQKEYKFVYEWDVANYVNWLNAHYLDFRGLIPKNLAIEAPSNIYKIK